MFSDGSKIPTTVYARYPRGIFIESLVQIGQVVPKEKMFERNNIKKQKSRKRATTPAWLNILTTDRSHHPEHFDPIRIRFNLTVLEIYVKKNV